MGRVFALSTYHSYFAIINLPVYKLLADSETKAWKRLFLRQEAKKLLHYEAILKQAQGVFTVTQKDTDYFIQHYENVLLVPSFNSFDEIAANPGKGSHVLSAAPFRSSP